MEKEATFILRSYGKGELARLYTPFVSDKSALAALRRWIQFYPGLTEALARIGYVDTSKRYTPAQVRLIVEALGEP